MKLITDSPALYCTSTPIQPAIDYEAPTTTPPVLLQNLSTRTARKERMKERERKETLRMMNRGDNKSVQVDIKH